MAKRAVAAPARVRLLDPNIIERNPENPRLIFRQDELQALQDSIASQGVLVPVSVYVDGNKYVLLDGERRWRCAVKLGLAHVPTIIQPKPDRMQNIMMMFAIHNARRDWDPLPTAYKLQQLQAEFERRNRRLPVEQELAELASISRGEVRRLRALLGLPQAYRTELMEELEKPRSEQVISVDHVLEVTRGAAALEKRGVIGTADEDRLRRALLDKFRARTERNTTSPRQLARIARAVERDEVSLATARAVAQRLIHEPKYTIAHAFRASVEQVDFEHGLDQLVERVITNLRLHTERGYEVGSTLRQSLSSLQKVLREFLAQ